MPDIAQFLLALSLYRVISEAVYYVAEAKNKAVNCRNYDSVFASRLKVLNNNFLEVDSHVFKQNALLYYRRGLFHEG